MMGAQSEPPLDLRRQFDLVVGFSQVYLQEILATTQFLHQVFWHQYGMAMLLQLGVHCNRVA